MTAPAAGPGPRGLRGRLLVSFLLVGVPPLLILAATVGLLTGRSLDGAARTRLDGALVSAAARLEALRSLAERRVAAVAEEDLPALAPPAAGDHAIASPLASRRALDALEVLDGEGRVVSSHHWPAGFGLPDRDRVFSAGTALRLETVAEGHGSAERLTITASRPTLWREAPVTVRGGFRVDEALFADLSSLMGLSVGLRDRERGLWVAPPGSALLRWADPPLEGEGGSGRVVLDGAPTSWATRRLSPELWLVVATPRAEQEALVRHLRLATLALAGGAALAGLSLALWLSSRIARPVAALAEGAQRVAAGDLGRPVPVLAPDELGALARAFNDMTAELRASRDRAVQAERVAAWREMARRLAHELKNPIFPMQLSLETLRRAAERQDPATFAALSRESVDTILEELAALKRIVEEFSEFARMPRPDPRLHDVNETVVRVLDLYRARAGLVAVEQGLEAGLPRVSADPELLARALGNLVANALEAMPQGGVLRVRTRSSPAGVVLEVEDSGPGLTEEQRTRLFTPYFTTKKGGTGLGLAIVQGIVSDHGGRVEVRSEPGRGTTFALVLPREGAAAEDGAAPPRGM